MQKKPFFFYALFILGFLVLSLWFLGGKALETQSLAFERQNSLANANMGLVEGTSKNNTNEVVRGVLSAYRQIAGGEGAQDIATMEAILKEKLNASIQNIDPVVVPVLSASNVRIVPSTPANNALYLNSVATLTRSVYYPTLSQELLVFNNSFTDTATENEKRAGRDALMRASTAYKTLANGLAKIPIPQNESAKTLALINAYHSLSAGSDLLAKSFNDPILSLQGLQAYALGYLSLKNLK